MNKIRIAIENTKDIQFINSICNWQPPNNFTIPYLFYTNKLVQKHNEHVFINILGLTFIFKAIDINHQSCPSFYKLLNDASKIIGLHFTIQILKKCWLSYLLVTMQCTMVLWIELMATTFCNKTIIWIMFQNSKFGTFTRKNIVIIISTTLNQNGHQLNLSSKI